MSSKILLALSLLVFVSAGAARAQDPVPTPIPTPTPTPTQAPTTPHVSENVVVKALRADDVTPVTKTDLERPELTAKSWGQEMPVLLQESPSVTAYSETGSGQGYAYLSLRGISQTRVNMTFDGVPLNEPEDSAVYTADFANLAGNLASVQIQRGVGTSTVGAASFAGSVNFESLDAARSPSLDLQLGAGSFGTARASANWNSGAFAGGWRLSLRPSWQTTDGFRESSGVKQDSIFFSVARDFETSTLRFSGFAGEERIQQAFLAVEKDVLEKDLTFNPLAPEEKDHFYEFLVTGQWTKALGPEASLSLQAYAVGAGGWYRLFADADRLDLKEYGLSWGFGGGLATYTRDFGTFHLTAGAHAYGYRSTHTQDDVDGPRNYLNHGYKNEVSGFAKLLGNLGAWHPFLDAQVRYAHLTYAGDVGEAGRGWTFFNPKAGVRVDLSDHSSAYASVGRTEREPARSDILLGEDNASALPDFDAVKPESVWDVELGAEWRTKDLVLRANLYDMEFHDEIALTGELSAIGLPLRRNVDRSFRRGLELDAAWQALPALRLTAAVNVNRSRISAWTQFYDVYDADGNFIGSTPRTFHDVTPLGTPPFVATAGFETTAFPDVTAGLTGRYVAASWLDNTNTEGLEAPRFFQLDASFRFDLSRLVAAGKPRLSVRVNNLLDNRRVFPSGYSYLYVTRDAGRDTVSGIPYYYAAATRSVSVTLDLGTLVSLLEVLGAVTGAFGVWLTAKENVWCWPVSLVNVAIYAVVFREAKLYADMGLQGVYFALCLYGWWAWLRGGASHGRLVVSRAPRAALAAAVLSGVAFAVVLGIFLRSKTDAALPLWDAGTTGFSLVAQFLQTRKWIENWPIWIAVDTVYVGMYVVKHLYLTAGLYALFLVLAELAFCVAAKPRRRGRRVVSVLKIVVTGGECTGKTTLARVLAERHETVWVPEAAREAALAKSGLLGPEDVTPIARAHVSAADAALREATGRGRPAVFFDQDLLSTVVYARHYYGDCPPWIERLAAERLGDLYILCPPDLPWTPDPARDRGDRREEMHALFAAALAEAGARVAEVAGQGKKREARAEAAVAELLALRA